MGLIGSILGSPAATSAIGNAASTVAEVFVPNATRQMDQAAAAYQAALAEHGEEFKIAAAGPFDRFVNGLNRLPRPLLALGTIGLFVYAMVDPESFARRMVGLNQVPEPLWWLLGAIVGFYFGAREAFYHRVTAGGVRPTPILSRPPNGTAPARRRDPNPALDELIAKAR